MPDGFSGRNSNSTHISTVYRLRISTPIQRSLSNTRQPLCTNLFHFSTFPHTIPQAENMPHVVPIPSSQTSLRMSQRNLVSVTPLPLPLLFWEARCWGIKKPLFDFNRNPSSPLLAHHVGHRRPAWATERNCACWHPLQSAEREGSFDEVRRRFRLLVPLDNRTQTASRVSQPAWWASFVSRDACLWTNGLT
jgi:hypothetical protein